MLQDFHDSFRTELEPYSTIAPNVLSIKGLDGLKLVLHQIAASCAADFIEVEDL